MGKNKLRKFAELEQMGCVMQYPFGALRQAPFPMRGRWHELFGNSHPIVLELGCGKGEYTVGLARLFPDKNFVGIDIKGARMYTGAKIVEQEGMVNARFLRTSIELLAEFFAPGEVDEIWVTFPDPQMKKASKRLTGTHFLDIYRQVLKPSGRIHLKTDSPFLYTYTRAMLQASNIEPVLDSPDLYGQLANPGRPIDELRPVIDVPNMRTHYEQQWLQRGLTIKLLSWALDASQHLVEPDIEIEPDSYRSYSRRSGKLQADDAQ